MNTKELNDLISLVVQHVTTPNIEKSRELLKQQADSYEFIEGILYQFTKSSYSVFWWSKRIFFLR